MALMLAYLIVFILAATPFFEVVGVIPLGVLAGMNAPAVALIAFVGNLATIWLLILLIDRVKLWLERRKARKGVNAEGKREKRAAAIWKKYGLPGLALISPITVGSHLGAIMAMSFGGTRRQITVWMTVSILAWTVVAGALAHFGTNLFFEQTGREGLLVNLLQAGK
jgi:uncharacterized membrane protein